LFEARDGGRRHIWRLLLALALLPCAATYDLLQQCPSMDRTLQQMDTLTDWEHSLSNDSRTNTARAESFNTALKTELVDLAVAIL